MITAKEALELTNTAGKRLIRIKVQMNNIEKSIREASLKGKRSFEVMGDMLPEVREELRTLGYEHYKSPHYDKYTVSW
jgi:hypothetical protein